MKKNRMMTEGKIYPQLFLFALPLVIGSIFQLSYNLFDFIIIGWFSSTPISSQAAVGIANPIMSIFISLFSGMCVGAGIHSSELYGKNDETNLKRQFTSCLIAGFIFSLVVTIFFVVFLNPILKISNVTDINLKEQVRTYLLIIAIGFVFCFIYNIYASFLRSIGDSYSSLVFLVVSCILNVVLDLVFVITFKMEVFGVALSTTISQVISAILIMLYGKIKYKNLLRFKLNEYVIDKSLLKTSSIYAAGSAMQQIVLFVGKYLISIKINTYDETVIDAFSSATKLDEFFFAPAQNFGHAAAIFISQNKGAKKYERAKKGWWAGFTMNLIYGVIISTLIALFKEQIMNMFISSDEGISSSKDAIVELGVNYYSIMALFYIFPCITNSLQSYFRGIGKLNFVFYSTFVQIIARVSFVYIFASMSFINPLQATAYATGVGWGFMISFEVPFLLYFYRTNRGLQLKN